MGSNGEFGYFREFFLISIDKHPILSFILLIEIMVNVAQLVERQVVVLDVVGSIPIIHPIKQ